MLERMLALCLYLGRVSLIDEATGERLVIYCQTTGVSAAHATHCATYCSPCRPLRRAFSGWIRTPPPTATGEVKWGVHAHAGVLSDSNLEMPTRGRFVASVGSKDENCKFWDAANGAESMTGAIHDGTGAWICRVTRSGSIKLDERCMVVEHATGLTALAFSSCGRRLAIGGKDGAVILWDAQTGRTEQRMEGGQYATIHSLSFSSDGARLARGSVDGSFRVWDATRE